MVNPAFLPSIKGVKVMFLPGRGAEFERGRDISRICTIRRVPTDPVVCFQSNSFITPFAHARTLPFFFTSFKGYCHWFMRRKIYRHYVLLCFCSEESVALQTLSPGYFHDASVLSRNWLWSITHRRIFDDYGVDGNLTQYFYLYQTKKDLVFLICYVWNRVYIEGGIGVDFWSHQSI